VDEGDEEILMNDEYVVGFTSKELRALGCRAVIIRDGVCYLDRGMKRQARKCVERCPVDFCCESAWQNLRDAINRRLIPEEDKALLLEKVEDDHRRWKQRGYIRGPKP